MTHHSYKAITLEIKANKLGLRVTEQYSVPFGKGKNLEQKKWENSYYTKKLEEEHGTLMLNIRKNDDKKKRRENAETF